MTFNVINFFSLKASLRFWFKNSAIGLNCTLGLEFW